MKDIFFLAFTFALLSFSTHSLKDSDPTNPIWPPYFSSEFIEAYTSQGAFRTTGNFWYDS